MLWTSAAIAASAAFPLERESYRTTTVSVPRGSVKPIGAIEFSSSASEGRRLGPWDYDLHESSGSGQVFLYDDGSVRGMERRVHHDKWGRRCIVVGNVTRCGAAAR